jgi:addiction module RelE/StbE family toxin
MTFQYLPTFKRQFKMLPAAVREQFAARLKLFVSDRTDPRLRVHPLRGSHAGYWSMNISGDVRAIYLDKGDEIIIFAYIGSHSELYG